MFAVGAGGVGVGDVGALEEMDEFPPHPATMNERRTTEEETRAEKGLSVAGERIGTAYSPSGVGI